MRLEIVLEVGDRVRVVRAPCGEENAWLLGKEGVIREISAYAYHRVDFDGRLCFMERYEIEPCEVVQ